MVSITELEAAINRARHAHPAHGREAALSPDVALLAALYGELIYRRAHQFELATLSPELRGAFERWRANR